MPDKDKRGVTERGVTEREPQCRTAWKCVCGGRGVPGKDGLCHISELSEGFVKNVTDVCKVGDLMDVKVIAVDDQNRVKLSRRAVLAEAAGSDADSDGGSDAGSDNGDDYEDD